MNMSAATSPSTPVIDWEFLLQKEGDRSWLPLDSPSVEILEGRYRVVARSGRPQTDVEIRVTHLATHETPPRRRAQKRPGRTNADGLMVVTPYTVMQPGIWELSCFSDVMSDLSGDGWRYSVRLHVLSREAEATDDWEPDWHPSAQTQVQLSAEAPLAPSVDGTPTIPVETTPPDPTPPDPTAEVAIPDPAIALANAATDNPWLQAANQLSQQIADDVAGEFDAMVEAESGLDRPEAAPVAPSSLPLGVTDRPVPPLQVRLHQESYVIHRGGQLTLAGQVLAVAASPGPVEWLPTLDRIISLRDPQSSQVLLHHRETLPAQPLPTSFTCELQLPLALSTRLMLGEVTLQATDSTNQTVLASQPFTVVSALNELLEAIADTAVMADDRFELSDAPDDAVTDADATPGLNLTFLEAINAPKTSGEQAYSPIAGAILPPQLYYPEPTPETSKKSLNLPNFAPIPPRDVPPELSPTVNPEPSQAERTEVEPSAPPPTGPEPPLAVTTQVAVDPAALEVPPLAPDRPHPEGQENDPTPVTATTFGARATAEPLNAALPPIAESHAYPMTDEFQALKLQDRFLDRLNALATDTVLSEELKAKVPSTERWAAPSSPPVEPDEPMAIDPQAELLAREVVVDDPAELASRSGPHPTLPKLAQTLPPEMVLPEHQDVPVPTLMLSAETLVAGQALTVQVKIPNLLPRIYVKLWMNDRQTRTLLEGPHWLVDFTPDGLGDQVAVTEVTIPFGSVEIDIAAIAVEMSTQRESYKAARNLSIIPAEMPASDHLKAFE